MSILGPGEFSLADKLQSPEHIAGRRAALERLHAVDPALAAEVISYAWPHERNRAWTPEEVTARLGLPEPAPKRKRQVKVAFAVSSLFLKAAAADFLREHMPSLVAGFDAFDAERERQAYLAKQRDAQHYPALHMTQPALMSYAANAMSGDAQPVTHHRHRHHSG